MKAFQLASGMTEAELAACVDSVLESQQRRLQNDRVPLSRKELLQICQNAF